MKTRSLSVSVSPAIGKVSAILVAPENPVCIMTFAHGAGAGMEHPFMTSMSEALAERSIATLRFNFPFMEAQKKRPDSPAVAHEAIAAAIKQSQKLFPALPVFAGGKSFGGRMSSQYLATDQNTTVKGIIFFGFPLHPAGKPAIDRAAHLKDVTVPMLFLQGTRDELASYELIKEVCASLKLATLSTIEGANHAFKAGKQDVLTILANNSAAWLQEQLHGKAKKVRRVDL